MMKRRLDLAGSNGSAAAMTLRARASTSAIGSASALARAVGSTPFGVRRNRGSLSSRRNRDRPWLTAEAVRFSRAAARPTWRSAKITSNSASRLRSILARLISFSILVNSYHWIHLTPTAILLTVPASNCPAGCKRALERRYAALDRSRRGNEPRRLRRAGISCRQEYSGRPRHDRRGEPFRHHRVLERSRARFVVRQG